MVKKVVVIGLDGLEPKLVEQMLKNGELPNFHRLREKGGYQRLRTTYPAQTPVAWSTFLTGTNPGGHGIFDFLGRDPNTYLPTLALSKYEQKNAFTPPKAVNLRKGDSIWGILTNADIPSTVIRCPCTFPPEPIKGRLISGVGVPDLRGGLGTSTYYTERTDLAAENSEKIVSVQQKGGRIFTHVIGPRDPKTRADLAFPIQITVDSQNKKVILHSEGQPAELVIEKGQWSDWLRVKFKAGMFQTVRGMVRFFLQNIEPGFEMYASPVNFDPEAPLFPISHPAEYSNELLARLGPFHTIGMAEDHDGLINGRVDENAYLQQCSLVVKERRKMLFSELDRFTEGFLYCLFDTPDRLQHMFWRFREPAHPANGKDETNEFDRAIEDHYQELDTIIGKVMKYLDDQSLLIVLSDHGMNSFQRGLNLNTWLCENGFLTLNQGLLPGDEANGDFFQQVDWGRTTAYALGLGGIYLNMRGREAKGIVTEAAGSEVKKDLTKGLTGLIDPERGQVAVRSVLSREQLYRGPYVQDAPDLLVNFASGYRVSWGTPLGGVPSGLFEDNHKKWGGDHVIDPTLVPGVLFMDKPFGKSEPDLVDLAPTILAALGVPIPNNLEGQDLLS